MLDDLLALDHALLRWLHAGGAPSWLVLAIATVTFLGSGWILLALLPAFARPALRPTLFRLLGSVLGTSALVWLLKELVGRVRPCHALTWAHAVHVTAPMGPSFPSGHSAGSFAFAVFVFWHHRRWGFAALAFACLVAASRVSLSVHYPSDVLAGAILGAIMGSLFSRRLDSRPRTRRSLRAGRPSPLGTCHQDIPSTTGSHDRA